MILELGPQRLAAGGACACGYGIADADAVDARGISAFALLLLLFFSVRRMAAAAGDCLLRRLAGLITLIDAAEAHIAKVSSFWEAFSKTAPIPNWKRAS
ncbi:hypothetical protein DK26_18855 [Bosea sp. WAO]|nr:hypothetical protein DK26_18855 [Bosea sp. WAO]